MSFGVGVGDIIQAAKIAREIHKRFSQAPEQYKEISSELAAFSGSLEHVVSILEKDQPPLADWQQQALKNIISGCRSTLELLAKRIDENALLAESKKPNGVREWSRATRQRLGWAPDEINDLRVRITMHMGFLTAFATNFDRMAIIETRTVSLETNRGMNDLLSMKKERVKVDETQEILDWLTRLDFDKERHDLLLRQKANTGKWFIESPEFRAWVETKKQTLLCHGFPGVGKTMLAAIAIDEIFKTTKAKDDGNGYQFLNNTNTGGYEDDNVGIGYVFGNFRRADELTCVAILASLTRQLAEKKDLPSDVLKMFKKHKSERSRPRLDELVSTLISIASRHATVFVVVDALDELHPDERASLTSALFSIQRGKADFRILATSRIIPEIVSEFKDAQHLEIRASEEDISTYLDGKMPGLPLFVRRNPELQEEIKSKINMAVDGVFLLAQLYMDSLRGNKSAKSIQRALENLLTGSRAYDDEYAKTLERIAGQLPETRNLAHEVISWISLAKRPLTVSELQHALTIEPGESQLDESNSPDVEAMVSACLGLVTVDESSQIIRLVHLTIQEYLERDTPAWLQDFKTTMAISCLTLLSFDEFQDGPCFRSDLQHRLQRNPLYEYAASHWGHHYHDCGQGYPATGTESLGVKFLRNYQKVEAAGQVMWLRRAGSLYGLDHGRDIHLPWVPHCGITGVHLAASFGLDTTLQALIDGGEFPDPKDGYGGTPLLWAVEQGRVGSVNILTDMSTVNLDAVGFRFRTPISIAAENGFLEIVKILVAKGVDIRQTDRFGLNPLSHAAYNCQLEVVRFLLELDPSQPHLDCQNIYGETALSRAIVRRDEKVVRLLLDKGANPNGGAEFGKEVTVSVLPGSKKADPYAPYLRKLTPLSYAVRSRHAGLCTLLLAAPRIDPNITDHYGWSPLMCAASYGYKSMVSLLLQDTRVDPNLPNPWKQTPLLRAALMGHTAVMAKLLERPDVDADRGGQIGRTPLSISAITGNHQAVELLLRHGVNPVTPDHHGRTPLAWAARSGGEAVVTQLLGANIASSMSPAGVPHVDWADKRGRTALFWAAKTGSGPVVKALLEAGARLEIADRSGRTALYVAVEGNHIEVTRVLLQELEPSEAVADKLAEAIDLAAFMQHCEVENILRERVGWPNIDVDDSFGITTLFSS